MKPTYNPMGLLLSYKFSITYTECLYFSHLKRPLNDFVTMFSVCRGVTLLVYNLENVQTMHKFQFSFS